MSPSYTINHIWLKNNRNDLTEITLEVILFTFISLKMLFEETERFFCLNPTPLLMRLALMKYVDYGLLMRKSPLWWAVSMLDVRSNLFTFHLAMHWKNFNLEKFFPARLHGVSMNLKLKNDASKINATVGMIIKYLFRS